MVMQYETKIDRFIMERKFPVHFDLFQKEGLGSPLLKNIFFDFLKKIIYLFLFLKDFIYFFLERGKERERNIYVWLLLTHPLLGTWPTTQACVLTGNRTGDLSILRPALNPPSHTSQGTIKFSVFQLHYPHSWCLVVTRGC